MIFLHLMLRVVTRNHFSIRIVFYLLNLNTKNIWCRYFIVWYEIRNQINVIFLYLLLRTVLNFNYWSNLWLLIILFFDVVITYSVLFLLFNNFTDYGYCLLRIGVYLLIVESKAKKFQHDIKDKSSKKWKNFVMS